MWLLQGSILSPSEVFFFLLFRIYFSCVDVIQISHMDLGYEFEGIKLKKPFFLWKEERQTHKLEAFNWSLRAGLMLNCVKEKVQTNNYKMQIWIYNHDIQTDLKRPYILGQVTKYEYTGKCTLTS